MEEIRLNKYLSEQGICSRREADRLIEAGKVTIDGRKAQMGEKVTGQEVIVCDGKPVGAAISKLQTSSVQITFFIFLILFTIMLIAEINIMVKAIKKGPEAIKGE